MNKLKELKGAVEELKKAILKEFEPLILFILDNFIWFAIFIISFFMILILIGMLDILS